MEFPFIASMEKKKKRKDKSTENTENIENKTKVICADLLDFDCDLDLDF